jgi:hypothetical protein
MKAVRFILRALAVLAVLLIGCKDDDNSVTPLSRELRLPLGTSAYATQWDFWAVADAKLFAFDIRNYPGADSIALVCHASALDSTSTLHIRLYNLTDSLAIAESEVTTSSTTTVALASRNLRKLLPDHPVDLQMELRKDGTRGGVTEPLGCYMILYSR